MPAPSSPTEPPTRLTCTTSVADYCAANACDRTLASAEQDKDLCPATITRCGNTTVVARNGVDVATISYYQGGQLVAIANKFFPGPRYLCLAGPESFVVPMCSVPGQNLPACGP